MRAAPPAELQTTALISYLADGWDLDVETAEYVAVGGGSYHWIVTDRVGTRHFVTADDLETKAWLGDTCDSVFDGLRRAFDTAAALRETGLSFVVAPIPTAGGETVRRIASRYTVALFPFVAGQAGTYGAYDAATRTAVVSMVAELHRATPVVASVARRIDLGLPGRGRLEVALGALDESWSGGPFSEPAREALTRHASDVAEWLALFDHLAADVAKLSGNWVVTHGEPHAANVLSSAEIHALVDWDTVALAPPERDLWILVGDSLDEEAARYTAATGHPLDRAALTFFRLMWDLEDIAAFTALLRSPHAEHADTAKAYDGLAFLLAAEDRWASFL